MIKALSFNPFSYRNGLTLFGNSFNEEHDEGIRVFDGDAEAADFARFNFQHGLPKEGFGKPQLAIDFVG